MNHPPNAPNELVCFNCGKALEKTTTFCPHCGAPLPGQGSLIPGLWRGLRMAAVLMVALIFGMFGTACFLIVVFGGSSLEIVFSGIIAITIAVLLFQSVK